MKNRKPKQLKLKNSKLLKKETKLKQNYNHLG